jgi:hypothetical protein
VRAIAASTAGVTSLTVSIGIGVSRNRLHISARPARQLSES